ncbi:MAG TPA: Fe-S cluster assembly protein SufD [Gemmatimonadaceae bacterium]|nr:Fe-S cluster assembly protein SufD [Gemmatimonadaceae bacterium]
MSFAEQFRDSGPAWLTGARRAAMDHFIATGFPTKKNEDWHFTSPAAIAEVDWLPLRDASGQVQPDDLAQFTLGLDAPRLVFVNGRYASGLSSLSGLPARVRVLDLAGHWNDAAAENWLTKIATPTRDAFTALNTAFAVDGAIVHVPADTVVEMPIHLLYVTDSEAAKGATHPRTLIVADRHSVVTVIESYVTLGDATYFTNAVTEIEVADGAKVDHYRIERESERAYHVGTTEVRQGRDSRYHSFSFATGGALARVNLYTVLGGEGGETLMHGLYMLDGTQHIDHQTRIEHAAPHCASREVYKGIMDDASHGVFNGKVYVQPEAQKTDGKQTNNNVLLSETAQADTKPQLEIFADDVKCTHGATVGRLDEVALFYLRSRGIDLEQARTLLTYAFAADVLERIDQPDVRKALEALTLERFVGGGAELVAAA